MKKSKNRIAKNFMQLVDRFQLGGAEEVATTYKKSLLNMGYACKLIGIDAGVTSQNKYLFKNYSQYFYFVFKECLQHKGLTVLTAHTTKSFLIAIICKLLLARKVKVVFVQHLNHNEKKVKLLAKLSFFCHRYIQITPITTHLFKKHIPLKKIFYLNNFIIDNKEESTLYANNLTERVKREAGNRKIITFIGAMRKSGKNPSHIFKIAKLLPEQEFYFLIIGDGKGSEVATFEKEMTEYAAAKNNFKWVGYQTDTTPFLKVSDYLFFSSFNDYEMMPMTILEGLATNTMVFSYNLEICKKLLPQNNIFQLNDYYSISKAILNNTLSTKKNQFDEVYGQHKLKELIATCDESRQLRLKRKGLTFRLSFK